MAQNNMSFSASTVLQVCTERDRLVQAKDGRGGEAQLQPAALPTVAFHHGGRGERQTGSAAAEPRRVAWSTPKQDHDAWAEKTMQMLNSCLANGCQLCITIMLNMVGKSRKS